MGFSVVTTFTGLGILTAAILSLIVIDAFLPFLRPSQLDRYLHTRDGEPAWALVTGASDGIGKALSHELASRGFNVVLHGRNPTKLEGVKQQLQDAHPTRNFRILVANATKCTLKTFEDMASQLADLHLTVLISNAGAGTSGFKMFEEVSAQDTDDLIRLNVTFPTMLIHAFMPSLMRSSPSLLIIIGSMADNGLPLLSAYGASKSYLRVLAKILARETRIARRDLEVMYYPLASVTGVSHTWAPADFMRPHSSRLAKDALARVGCGRTVISPYWPHQLSGMVLAWLPSKLNDAISVDQMLKLQAEGLNAGLERKKTE